MSQIADRYAKALFGLAEKSKKLDVVRTDLLALTKLVDDSEAVRKFIFAKRFGRKAQQAALTALAAKLKLSTLTQNFLGLLSQHGRLNCLQLIVEAFDNKVASHNNEAYVYVESADPLTAGEEKELTAGLKQALGKKVMLRSKINEAILGGLKVRFGSKLVDGSYQTRLTQLHLAMKGV